MASPPPLTLNVVGSDPNADTNTFPTVTSSFTPPSPRRSSPLQNLSPGILIIVTVLAVTVIVSLALCFLLRHLNRRCLRRFSSSSAAPSAAATPIFSSSRRISPEILPSSAAAAASASVVIDKLPLFTFSSVTRRSAAAVADCAVCLSKFHHNDLLRLLPLCCHAFHAECIDTWLQSNLSCPLCRSAIVAEDSDLAKIHRQPSSAGSSDSFRLELGNISRGGTDGSGAGSAVAGAGIGRGGSRSYSIGSFEYLIDDESEVPFSHARGRSVDDAKEFPASANENEASLAGEVGGVRSWLKDYVDRFSSSISSGTASFRSSGRFFSGGGTSGCRSDVVPVAAEYDIEGNRIGEEITEMFRWLSGV